MKILRIRLRNYRGIEDTQADFVPFGLTVVEGPNEAGKTSLAESISILFEYPDSSRHRSVEAVRPVHRDAGTEIEVQAEAGPCAFTYFKRFHKKPETVLRVVRPRPENHTGREAHERAGVILREAMDLDLWRALNLQQGEELRQPDLGRQTSLSAALDRAAGGRSADPAEEGLFERVRAEYANYYTERGIEKKAFQDVQRMEKQAREEAAFLSDRLKELEKDVDRVARLRSDLALLARQEQEIAGDMAAYGESLDAIRELETALETTRLKLESARKSETAARTDAQARQDLVQGVGQAQRDLAVLEAALGSSDASLRRAEEALRQAQAAAARSEEARRQAEGVAALRRADFDYFNNRLHLEQLQERRERIDRARREAAEAEELLSRNRVDEKALHDIQRAERELIGARARLESGSPSVTLKALTALTVELDGRPESVRPGEPRRIYVPDRMRLTIPDTLDVEVAAGASAADLARGLDEAGKALEKACAAAGVAGPDQGRRAFEERREALRTVAGRDRIERENLRDLTYDELERKVVGLGKSIPAYPRERAPSPPLCEDLGSAKKELIRAETELDHARREWERMHRELNSAREVRDGLRESGRDALVQLELKREELKSAADALARARARAADDALQESLYASTREVRAQEERAREGEQALRQREPEKVRTLMEAAKGSLETASKRRREAETELAQVRARLQVLGEEGLHEKLLAAETRLERASRESAALSRRASAARLLFETMKEERDHARRAYVAPLREKIEQFGRILFNDSFQVEVNDDLMITNRTLDGKTVPFDSLSGGTREQLSLITRLACAMLVGRDGGGAPLILDDALGYTDPERLKLMGALLARAGQDCQIIILTCMPERYWNVGVAAVVRMGGEGAQGAGRKARGAPTDT